MGYQAEGSQWRGIFLTAAKELREGVQPAAFATASPDTVMAMPIDILFDFAAVHVIGERAAEIDVRMDFTFSDLGETWTMWVRRVVLNARRGAGPNPDLSVRGPKAALVGIVLQPDKAKQVVDSGAVATDGDTSVFKRLAEVMDTFDPNFEIVTP